MMQPKRNMELVRELLLRLESWHMEMGDVFIIAPDDPALGLQGKQSRSDAAKIGVLGHAKFGAQKRRLKGLLGEFFLEWVHQMPPGSGNAAQKRNPVRIKNHDQTRDSGG